MSDAILGNEGTVELETETDNPSGTESQELEATETSTEEQGQGSDGFFSGNPMELPDEVRPFYTSMQGQFTRSMQDLRGREGSLQAKLDQADEQLRELNLLKARYDAQPQAPASQQEAAGTAGPTGLTDEQLSERVSGLARDGKPFEALTTLADVLSERKVNALKTTYDQRLSELQSKIENLQGAVQPAQEQIEIRSAWTRLQQERPEFADQRVQSEISKIVANPPPRIERLMNQGMHEEALELAGLQAVRAVETQSAVTSARQRKNAGLPPGKAGGTAENGATGVDWNASVREIMNAVISNDESLSRTLG